MRRAPAKGANDDDLEEEERAEQLEAAEALRLQRAHASKLRAEDFGEIDAADDMPAASAGRGNKKLDDELAELPYALRGSTGFEAVARDLSGLSEAALARAVEADAPELLHLLGDFKETLREARTRVAPLLQAAKARQLPPEGGVQLLQVKLQLMLSYATNIAFYLLLKAQGRAVREHPVIDALLKHRVLLERIRPLEQKQSYRLGSCFRRRRPRATARVRKARKPAWRPRRAAEPRAAHSGRRRACGCGRGRRGRGRRR